MRKFNYFCSILLVITMPLMIMILSSNLILRTSTVYSYHFNDSEALSEVYLSVDGATIASGVSSYWSSFSSDKFQVYEVNGEYKDPVFNAKEQSVMKKTKNVLTIELLIGILFAIITIGLYVYFVKNKFIEALRKRFIAGTIATVAVIIVHIICFSIKSVRMWLYNALIGVKLAKTSTLALILGDPLFKTYLIFSSVLAVAALGIFAYINHKYTKPARIFY